MSLKQSALIQIFKLFIQTNPLYKDLKADYLKEPHFDNSINQSWLVINLIYVSAFTNKIFLQISLKLQVL